jgi:hypothetical protein
MSEEEFWTRAERVHVQFPDSVVADLASIGVSPVLTVARFDDGQTIRVCVGDKEGPSFFGTCPAAVSTEDVVHFVAAKVSRMADAARGRRAIAGLARPNPNVE